MLLLRKAYIIQVRHMANNINTGKHFMSVNSLLEPTEVITCIMKFHNANMRVLLRFVSKFSKGIKNNCVVVMININICCSSSVNGKVKLSTE
jgi:hypothetical protein